MKKIIALALVLVISLSLFACGGGARNDNGGNGTLEVDGNTSAKDDTAGEDVETEDEDPEAEDSVAEDFAWTLEDGVLTVSGHGKMPDVYELDNGRPWTWKDHIEKVVVSEGLTSVSSYAFGEVDDLVTVELADTVKTLEEGAFYQCFNLEEMSFGKNLKTIGAQAFEDCEKLTSMDIPDGVKVIGESAFSGCDSLTDIYYSGTCEKWNSINQDDEKAPEGTVVHCSDGDIE